MRSSTSSSFRLELTAFRRGNGWKIVSRFASSMAGCVAVREELDRTCKALYAPFDDLAFGDAFANVGEDERLDLAFRRTAVPLNPR